MTKQHQRKAKTKHLAYRVDPDLYKALDEVVVDTITKERYVVTRSAVIDRYLREGLERDGYKVAPPPPPPKKGS